MPYRIDVRHPGGDGLDLLVRLGALDVETTSDGLAAILPDRIAPRDVSAALGGRTVTVSAARGRDDDSVWMLSPHTIRAGGIVVAPVGADVADGALRLSDAPAFGSGYHPTTVLCLEILDECCAAERPDSVLDVGTGSGVLALAALLKGVPRAVGLDVDAAALTAATAHAALNGVSDRLMLVAGGPEAVHGTWPLVLANVLAAPLIEMAPMLVRRVGHRGRLVLSGVPDGVAADVEHAYRRQGMHIVSARSRAGWTAVVAAASW
jgi:ribosomal protein L11 methyltransferase